MRKATILIVEDDGILALHLQDMLSRLGYTVAGPLASGERAVAFVGEHPIDLILMDIELRGTMNGIDAAETIQRTADIPIVFLTGFSQDPLVEQAKIATPYGYLIKPVPERELVATLELALHRHCLDRKLTESRIAQHKSEAQYRHLFENSPLGIFRTTLDGSPLLVNAEMARIVGCTTPEEAISEFKDLAARLYVDPGRRKEFISLLQQHGAINHFEYEGRKKNGEALWISMNARLTPADNGQAGGWVIDGFAIDITDRKRAEEALRESEQKFRTLANHGQALIWTSGTDKYCNYFNDIWLEFTGRSLEQEMRDGWAEGVHPDDLQRCLDIYTEAFDRREKFSMIYRLRRHDGEYRWILDDGCPRSNTKGEFIGYIGHCLDITEHRQTEEAFRESEEIHRALVAGLPDIVMRFDRKGRHLFVSENVSEVVDIQAAQFIGKTHGELGFPEELCKFWGDALQRVFDTGLLFETEFQFEGRRGPAIHNWRLIPERDGRGEVKSVLSLSRDVTSYRRTEQNYQTLFHQMLDGFALHEIICDGEGIPVDYRFLAVNPAFERMTGLKSADIIGRSVREVMPGIENYWIETYGKVALTGEPIFFENAMDELKKYFQVTAYRPLRGQFACIFADITERRRAEEEKKHLRAQLQQAQKMEAIGTLAGGIAHDFNNILGAILGYAEMAQEDCPSGSQIAQDLDQVIRAGTRARDLVKQILAFSRQAATQQVPLQPASIVKEAIKLLRSSLPTTIAIEQDVDAESGLVFADPTQIHQVLMNLCTNAFHAMEAMGGVLTISLKKKTFSPQEIAENPGFGSRNFVQLSVGDSGPGIAPEIKGRIFDPYFTTKETGKGTGMGLAIVHGIVKSYGGSISCNSRPGEGAVFTITLPALEEPAVPVSESVESIPVGSERILFIDDEAMLAEMGGAMLERLGYTVTTQTSSLGALAYFRSRPDAFDLVITDQTMPEMTGMDLAQSMLAIRPHLPIILCTGYSNLISGEKARSMGISGFALKPLAKKDLAVLVRKTLDH